MNYALSYDPEDVDSLCLMGRIYSKMLTDYNKAKLYFEEAIQCDMTNLNVPQYYIKCLLDNEDLNEAEKLISYSLKIKGIDRSIILMHRSLLSEKRGSLANALKFLKEAEKHCFTSCSLELVKERKKFIQSKRPKNKTKKKKEIQ
ncbi:hypothetical protein SD427_17775 [Chryseobacterium sp. JJR-5R]|uniref:hypothetical protein n=1 Tax=Chryseobacterium sp. JJR-5R TaxID=3093923 RepID=UPI002A75EA31|nr:hypothetical protein [Chryseobacterium sp. JJR-5R]WPO82588.1 hypothetical protein SD427_17775 [Chryseobacterium sp. JJR-5R]